MKQETSAESGRPPQSQTPNSRPARLLLLALLVVVASLLVAFAGISLTTRSFASDGIETPVFLPIARLDPTVTPTPTSTPVVVLPPTVIGEVPLPEAYCPNDVEVNPISGYAYITNNGNNTASIIQELNHIDTMPVGEWPSRVGVDPNTTRAALVSLRETTISLFDLSNLFMTLPTYGEAYDVIFNQVNGLLYANDLFSRLTVYDSTTYEFKGYINLASGWLQGMVVDPNTGLLYVANLELGKVFTIDGMNVVGEVQAGWGVQELAIDPNTGYLYAAHSAPNATYPDNISIMKDSQFVTSFKTGVRSQDVAVNPNYGLAYITLPEDDAVSIIQGTGIAGRVTVGDNPWSVDVNPLTGRAYVSNRGSNTISIFDLLTYKGVIDGGAEPFNVAVDATRNLAYVTNRTSHIQCNAQGQCETVCDPNPSVSVVR